MTADEMLNSTRHLLYHNFVEIKSGKIYTYQGILITDDDYYYCLYSKEHGLACLSCVGNIDTFGFEEIKND